ncbi:hypothetical protein D9611_004627 [Ephemerocybe angulata]|uniref:Uncharacterized protein n=2 Tax=Ephemerocybe angulata TaxID=980116 RepID=A0A8H5B487_9AGAR|nr:hypothetical protein D9611_004627 [Tulosesus angulatus]KAF6765132.1 DNA primase large subunit Spp2 [Tulosesus angulatus]
MFKSSERKPFQQDSVTYQGSSSSHLQYPHRLNFYDKPPLFDVAIEEFETCALDRLRVLAEIESSAARNRTWEESTLAVRTQCDKHLVMKPNSSKYDDLDEQRRKDHLSHFVLRLAFCRSEDLRRRYVKAESTLFRMRYEDDAHADREAFLNSRDFNCLPVPADEKAKYHTELSSLYFAPSKNEAERKAAFEREKYFKVKWTRVPDLVEKRRVFLNRGWAYVPSQEQSSIIFQEFESRLEKALEMTARLLPRLDEDTRLIPILNNLSQGFIAGSSSDWMGENGDNANGEELKAEMIDDMSKRHFPMCMKTLHDRLQRDNHLKHFGRLQYGLFLKVLGLSVEEAIVFWRKSFSRITDDKFNKEYRYNIRHTYGLEGKRANYPAKNCLQVMAPGAQEYGCPYKTYNPDNLQSALLSTYSHLGLKAADLPDIMQLVGAHSYHTACTRVFEVTHGSCGVKKGDGLNGEHVTHPNQYAAHSRELYKAAAGGGSSEDMVVVTS